MLGEKYGSRTIIDKRGRARDESASRRVGGDASWLAAALNQGEAPHLPAATQALKAWCVGPPLLLDYVGCRERLVVGTW